MTRRIILLTGLLFSGFITQVMAQKYDFKTYSVNDGLPSSYVYDVLVDDLGVVWFATANGLAKFDGKNFRNYTSDDGLNDEIVHDIYKDKEGSIWAATELGGLYKFENNTFVTVNELSELDSLLIHYVSSGPNGSLWIGTDRHGIYEWKKDGQLVQKLTTENGLPDNQVWDIFTDNKGRIWISTSSGVVLYEEDGGITYTLSEENGLSGKLAYQVFEDTEGNKWIPTSDGITIIRPDFTTDVIKEINGIALGYVFSINQDDRGDIWIGTERDGLFIYDGSEFTQIKKRNGLSSNFIYRLVKDKSGNIWIATDGDGVSVLRNRDFLIFDTSSDLNANSVFSTLKHSDGSIWMGTENGISKFKDGKFTNYTIPEEHFDDGEIWDIEELPNGNIIMLALDYDLIEFDGKNFFHPEFYDPLYEYYVNDIFIDKEDDSIWFAAYQALLKYKNGKLTKFSPPDEVYWQTDLISISKDSRGEFWVGTHAGLANFDGVTFKYITSEEGLEGGSIYDVKEDPSGNLWVGTSKGLFILKEFNEEGMPQKIIPFETLDLYMQETIFLQFDMKGNLWQGTNGGLNSYELSSWEEGQITPQKHFPFNDFGHGIEFNGAASVIEEDGTLWFGSNSKGIIKLEKMFKKAGQKELVPDIFLREVLVNNSLVYNQYNKNLDNSDIVLSYDENNLNFRFNGTDFINPNRISYKYKLKGFDVEWNTGQDIDEVRYTSIPDGKYEFLVQAKSIKSSWSEPIVLATINIEKPFWKTIGFFILVGLTFVLAFVILARVIAESLEKKDLKRLVDEQTRDIQSALHEKEVLIKEIHHRVKNNLAVVSGLLELQSWNIPDGDAKDAIQESKMRVLAMSKIHENLYQNKDLAKVNFKIFLEDLVESVAITMKKTDHTIDLVLDVEETHIDVNTGIPIGLIVNELITNCYKHAFTETRKGEIVVRFKNTGSGHHLLVEDNGKGSENNILEHENRNSLGLTLIKSLSAQIYAEVIYSGEKGASFNIRIPKSKTKATF